MARNVTFRLAFAAFLGLVGTITACSDDDADVPIDSDSPSLACSLFSAKEAEKLLGGEVGEAGIDLPDSPTFSTCSYQLRQRNDKGDSLYFNIQDRLDFGTRTETSSAGWKVSLTSEKDHLFVLVIADNAARAPLREDVEAAARLILQRAKGSCIATASCAPR